MVDDYDASGRASNEADILVARSTLPHAGDESVATRISLFVPNLAGGGAERMMVNLAGGLADAGIPVDLVLATASGPYLSEVSAKVRLVDLRSRGVAGSLVPLIRYLRRTRPTVVLSTLNHASVVALFARRLAGVETSVFVREANTVSRKASAGIRARVVRALVPRTYRWADGIIAVSEGVADDLHRHRGIAYEKIHTVSQSRGHTRSGS